MKKIGMLFVVIVLLQCTTLKNLTHPVKPKVRFHTLHLSSLSLSHVKFEAQVIIENPNPMELTIPGLDYALEIEGKELLNWHSGNIQHIAARGMDTLSVPLTLEFAAISKMAKQMKMTDSLHSTVFFTVFVDMPILGRIKVPVSKSVVIARPMLPRLTLKSLRIKKMSFSGADLECAVSLLNRNDFPLTFSHINYDLQLNGKKIVSGSIREQLHVEKDKALSFIIPIHINFLEAGASVVSILKNDGMVEFTMNSAIKENGSDSLIQLPILETATKILQ